MKNCLKKPGECVSINDVRAEIDRIDNEIIRLIGERYQYVKEVVKYKNPDKMGITAKERYDSVIKERGAQAEKYGVDPVFIEQLYKQMLDYFIDKQLQIINVNK